MSRSSNEAGQRAIGGPSRRPEERDPKAAHAAPEEREPNIPVLVRAPSPSPAKASLPRDESQFPSREGRTKKLRGISETKLLLWETWCSTHKAPGLRRPLHFYELIEQAVDEFMARQEWGPGSPQARDGAESGSPLGPQAPTPSRARDKDLFPDSVDQIQDKDQNDDDKNIELFSSSSTTLNCGLPGAQTTEQREKQNEVLAFYEQKTGNRIKPYDELIYRQGNDEWPGLADVPLRVILYGIMESRLRPSKPKKVFNFSYFLPCIHELNDEPDLISEEIFRMLLLTFDVRMEAKLNPGMPHEEFMEKIRQATRQEQPRLPGVGGAEDIKR